MAIDNLGWGANALINAEDPNHAREVPAVSIQVDDAVADTDLDEGVFHVDPNGLLLGCWWSNDTDFREAGYASSHPVELPPIVRIWGTHYTEEDGVPFRLFLGQMGALEIDSLGGTSTDEAGRYRVLHRLG